MPHSHRHFFFSYAFSNPIPHKTSKQLTVPPAQFIRLFKSPFYFPKMSSSNSQISVLFVCLGNICRSTMSEGVFRSIVSKPPYKALIKEVDSCGTAAYHVGDSPDSRTMSTLEDHGINDYRHSGRQVCIFSLHFSQ